MVRSLQRAVSCCREDGTLRFAGYLQTVLKYTDDGGVADCSRCVLDLLLRYGMPPAPK